MVARIHFRVYILCYIQYMYIYIERERAYYPPCVSRDSLIFSSLQIGSWPDLGDGRTAQSEGHIQHMALDGCSAFPGMGGVTQTS